MIVDLIPRVRRLLGVTSAYDDNEVTDIIRGAIRKLLRDYNFPKSRARAFLGTGAPSVVNGENTLELSDMEFPVPTGFKAEGVLYFFDPVTGSFSAPLTKREAFSPPPDDGYNKFYWITEGKVILDEPVDWSSADNDYQLVMLYQTMDVDSNEAWITEEFEDAVVYLACTRGAVEVRKPDLAQAMSQLWTDEQNALAIYLNELEWDNVEMVQREPAPLPLGRYPIDPT